MTLTPAVDNVLSVYYSATPDNLRNGVSWYLDANNFAAMLVEIYDIPGANLEMAAGVIAAMSPMMEWSLNKRVAATAFARGNANGAGLARNCAKANAILAGANPLDILGGNKVRAFYRTIVEPTGDIDPVIDRHAFDIAVGKVTDDKTRGILGRKGMYESFAGVYREAARLSGIGSAQMQAVTWMQWREDK